MKKRFYLEEVFNPLWVVAVALSTYSLHFFDLTRLTSSLDVFEVNVGFLAEIHDRAKEVKQTLKEKRNIFKSGRKILVI